MLRYFFLHLIAVLASIHLPAQNYTIKEWAEKLENEPQHTEVITKINLSLNKNNLTAEERLSLQIVLVHKFIALQKWDTCINYCQQQIYIAHQNNNVNAEARFYLLLGNTYYNIIKKDKALEYWLKAIEVAEKNKLDEVLEHSAHNTGVYYLEIHDYTTAEKYFLRSIEIGRKNKTLFTLGGIRHMRLLATLYAQTKRYNQAENLYKQVIDTCRAIKDSDNLKEALSFYSELMRSQKRFESALKASREAISIDSIRKNQDITLTTLRFHAYNLYASGQYKEAYLLMNQVNDSSAKMYNQDVSTKISLAEAKFKNSEIQHEKELALLKAKKEKQMYLLSFTGLLFTIGTGLYFYYRRKNLEQKLQLHHQVQSEKERLSRDLHDSLGSQMTLLSNNIETLDAGYKRKHVIEKNIERVKDASRQLFQTLRGTIWILDKEQISAQDFFDKLVDHAHRFLQSSHHLQLSIVESFEENKMLNNKDVLQLYRICQEAINNAVKYSKGKTLKLAGAVANGKLMLEIADDGTGFDTQKDAGEEHFGLRNMQRRAREINAEFYIQSEKGKGTSIKINL